jgi:anthranilate/para-aminobenzoate synthase component II
MTDQISLRSLNSNRIFILDFEDSFTYNIAASLNSLGRKSLVIPFEQHETFFKWLDQACLTRQKPTVAIIFGPGPGHPDDYSSSLNHIKKLMKKHEVFLMGICLGHQLIWKAKGHKIVTAKYKLHGKVKKCSPLLFKDLTGTSKLTYQRYNSLEVKVNLSDLEAEDKLYYDKTSVLWSSFSNGVSYQFHPESVGTSCPEIFFRPLLNFLYNKVDECHTNPRRTLRSKSF